MRMFTFHIKHVVGGKYSGPDRLSGRGVAPKDSEDEDPEKLEPSMDGHLARFFFFFFFFFL